MQINNLSIEQRAYLAGLIDGEGYVGVISNVVVLKITQAEKGKDILDIVKNWLGVGTVGLHRKSTDKWQAVYRYRLQSTLLNKQLFEQIEPYLNIKKDAFKKALNNR
jgi:hypothetical protein